MGVMQEKITIQLHNTIFDPWLQLAAWSSQTAAAATFIGRVREVAQDGRPLEALELTHYPGMCEEVIRQDAQRLLMDHDASSVSFLEAS